MALSNPSSRVIPLTEEQAARNEIFLNAVSGALCWKDQNGAIHIISVDAETYFGFSVENMPPATWQPYSAIPWNAPIVNPEPHPNSAALAAFMLAEGGGPRPGNLTVGREELGGAGNEKTDFGHPLLWAANKDPIYTIHCTKEAGNPNEGAQLRIPTTPKPPWAQGTDGHLIVAQPSGLAPEFFQVASIAAGVITCNWCDEISLASSTGFLPLGPAAGVTASNASLLGGEIRPEEILAFVAKGPSTIKHALCFTTNKVTTSIAYGYGTTLINGTGAVYPATHSQSAGGSAASGAPPLGARFRLNLTKAEVEALNLPPWKECIAMCLVEYGAYCIDVSGSFGFALLSDRSYNAYNKPSPLVAYSAAHESAALQKVEGFYVWKLAETIPWSTALQFIAPPAH